MIGVLVRPPLCAIIRVILGDWLGDWLAEIDRAQGKDG
jgi:hypothetical protein